MNTIVKVKEYGHQFYQETEGELLKIGSTVEMFNDKLVQVPCITILNKKQNKIKTISLKSQNMWTEVDVVKSENPEEEQKTEQFHQGDIDYNQEVLHLQILKGKMVMAELQMEFGKEKKKIAIENLIEFFKCFE
jgi:hypothetical protein